MLDTCQQVTAIPMKRAAPAETHFLERDEVEALLRHLPRTGRRALRDHTLLLFLYNTGARAQEVADLRAGNLELGENATVRLHGKGDKWRTCPLWHQTATLLAELLDASHEPPAVDAPVFCSVTGDALTRFGIYKIVRRHAGHLDDARTNRRVSPHIFRHTAAVHLLEAGVEINVIRGWLGHADLTTTNRYAEINTRAKTQALRTTEPPILRRDPAHVPSGDPTNRCSTGCHRSDRYVARGNRSTPPLPGIGRHWPHNPAGHRTRTTCGRLLDDPLPWTRMRAVYRLLGLVRRYTPEPVEAACATSLDLDVVSVTKIASMLARATEKNRPVLPAAAGAPTGRFARDPASSRWLAAPPSSPSSPAA
jgi:hypothetical protein